MAHWCERTPKSLSHRATQSDSVENFSVESDWYLPMSPQLQTELKSYVASRGEDSPDLFPGRSAQSKGKKIYSRRRLFEKIRRVTAFNAYMEKHPSSTTMQARKELKRQSYPGGVIPELRG